ncbi:MAG: hypothetical protein MJA29_02555, partial [Candidatus Omnitrophica bacterium]|nr:hypothetical protein [Candidatus Omnitrophota bacterium]
VPHNTNLGLHKVVIKVAANDFYMESVSGKKSDLESIVFEVDYEVIQKMVPFKLVKYQNAQSGERIASAAIADVEINNVQGNFVITQTEEGSVITLQTKDKNDRGIV